MAESVTEILIPTMRAGVPRFLSWYVAAMLSEKDLMMASEEATCKISSTTIARREK